MQNPNASAFEWLHSLVDGEVDVDRADYLLRDGQALGLDFASYDIDRLVNNLVLAHGDDVGFVTAVNEAGLPALESYCLSRSRSTEVFIHHHKVAQINLALRYVSVYVYEKTNQGRELLKFLENLAVATESDGHETIEDLLQQFSGFDDGWWFQGIRALRNERLNHHDTKEDPLLEPCLDLILDRARSLASVWKRRGDLSPQDLKEANESVDAFSRKKGVIDFASIRASLLKKNVLVLPFKFRPFVRRPDPTTGQPAEGRSLMMVKTKTQGLVPACRVSSRINSLLDAWNAEIHLYACTTADADLDAARKAVFDEIRPKVP